MLLKDLIPSIITRYEEIQLVSAKTGRCLTDVTYFEGGSPENVADIEGNMENQVIGLSSDISDRGNPFIRIMVIDIE